MTVKTVLFPRARRIRPERSITWRDWPGPFQKNGPNGMWPVAPGHAWLIFTEHLLCLIRQAWKEVYLCRLKRGSLCNFGHVMRKKGDSLEKEIMQGITPGSRSQDRPKTAWMSNITSWKGLSFEQLLRAVEDRYQWRLTVHDAANLRAHVDGWRQDKTIQVTLYHLCT